MRTAAYVSSGFTRPPSASEPNAPDTQRIDKAFAQQSIVLERIYPSRAWKALFGRGNQIAERMDLFRALRMLLRQHRYEFVYASSDEIVAILLFFRSLGLFRPKVVLHDLTLDRNWRAKRIVSKYCIQRADAVLTTTLGQMDDVKQYWGAKLCRFGGLTIDRDFFSPQSSVGKPPEAYIFAPGEDHGRDYETLFSALRKSGGKALIKRSRYSLTIPQDLAEQVDLVTERVSYARFREMYQQAEIVVMPAVHTANACGITVCAEAMCMARPLIVSATNVLERDLPDDVCLKVPVGDAAAMAEAIRWVRSHPEKADVMARAAQDFARSYFDPARLVSHILSTLDEDLQSRQY